MAAGNRCPEADKRLEQLLSSRSEYGSGGPAAAFLSLLERAAVHVQEERRKSPVELPAVLLWKKWVHNKLTLFMAQRVFRARGVPRLGRKGGSTCSGHRLRSR